MKTSLLMDFTVDKVNNKILVKREFAAPLSNVWAAWTESRLLDQWWAPKPWKARTKELNFKEGGTWIYAMVGPDGTESWARADFETIQPLKRFTAYDTFCDENGNINHDFPGAYWNNEFSEYHDSTMLSIEVKFKELSDLEKYIEMGFKEGFTSALENLDQLLG